MRLRGRLEWVFIGLLALLCAYLGVLQFGWVDQVAQAEQRRLQRDLRVKLNLLSRSFNEMVLDGILALSPRPREIQSSDLRKAFTARLADWQESHQELFRRVAVASPERGRLQLLTLDATKRKLVETPWPEAWTAIRNRLEARESGRSGPPGYDPKHSEVIVVPRFGRPRDGNFERQRDWLICELNLDYLRTSVFPDLLGRYMAGDDDAGYMAEITVRENPSIVIYQSDPGKQHLAGAAADASVPLLGVARNAARVQQNGRWLLFVQNRSGPLEQIVAEAKLRNVLTSAGLLLLIVAMVFLLVRLSRQRERLAELQMEFVAGVSHELKTPLSVIRTAAYNLRSGLTTDREGVQDYGKLIESETASLGTLVDRVMLFAQSGRNASEKRAVDVGDAVRNALEISLPKSVQDQYATEVNIAPDLPPVWVDPTALKHVLRNLIENAMKYGAREDRWIGLSAERARLNGGNAVKITVADHGSGVPPEDRAHIFDAFYRGRHARQEQIHGTGLGLSLAKRAIETNGGRISLESNAGNGARFIVLIPAASETDEPENSADRG